MEILTICKFPENYNYLFKSYVKKEGVNFTCVFKINLRTKESVQEWVSAYQEKAKVTWRKARTFKAMGKHIIFRNDFRCQHKTDARRRSVGKRISKHTNCPSVMKVTIKRYYDVPKFQSPDEETKSFPCEITVHSWHNHSLTSASVLRFRDISEVTKEKLLKYFRFGYTASAARHALQTDLLLESPEEYESLAADTSILPTLSVIHHFFNSEFNKIIKDKDNTELENFIHEYFEGFRDKTQSVIDQHTNLSHSKIGQVNEDLEAFLQQYCEHHGGKAMFKGTENDNKIIALCTPTMQRTSSILPQVNEIVLVDDLHSMDVLNHTIYFFMSPTIVGGAPIGCIITDSETEQALLTGVSLLKMCFPQGASITASGPKVFMTDGNINLRNVLQKTWPWSKFLVCQSHILKSAWRWLINPRNGIEKHERQSLYFILKSLIYSKTEQELIEHKKKIDENTKYENFIEYVSSLWQSKEHWATCYRKGLPLRVMNTNGYIEALFRILKYIIFDRVKAHNTLQLVEFILTKYEAYLVHRYLEFSWGRYNKNLLKKFLLDVEITTKEEDISFDKEKNFYIIQNENEAYFVDMSNCFCSCSSGSIGRFCKHIMAVVHFHGGNVKSNYWYCEHTRNVVYEIATGKKPPKDFLMPLTFNPNKSLNCAEGENVGMQVSSTTKSNFSLTSNTPDAAKSSSQNKELQILSSITQCSVQFEKEFSTNTDALSNSSDTAEIEQSKMLNSNLSNAIKIDIKNNHQIFIPVVTQNLQKYVSTETGNYALALQNSSVPINLNIQPNEQKGLLMTVYKHCVQNTVHTGKRKFQAILPKVPNICKRESDNFILQELPTLKMPKLQLL